MPRVYNFSAGPAILPEPVLAQAAADMMDYQGCGMSVMEMSHRSPAFQGIIDNAEADLRDLMGIPKNYDVLFLQGGDSLQFAAVPMNLALAKHGVADYIVTGQWSKKAQQEAARFIDARIVATGAEDNFSHLPDCSDLPLSEDADYVYLCQNETVHGLRFAQLPDTKGKVLVSDQSSMFLSEPVDVSQFGLIHAGVQKNVGPAGVQIVIVRHDLVPEGDIDGVPVMMNYKTHVDKKSLYNTPPCWNIYMCGLVFKHLKELGGLEAVQKMNQEKAQLLYDAIDESALFKGVAAKEDRSMMNVCFVTGDADLDAKFAKEAAAAGLTNLKGHRSVGGLRASIYNAMPRKGVEALIAFMKDFEVQNR